MSQTDLALLALGTSRPPPRLVTELAAEAGVSAEVIASYSGWQRACIARPDEHPSTLAVAALRQALGRAGVVASDLRLVISSGVSRDYPPSWSVATEVMRLVEAPGSCLGIDLTVGCLATLVGLEVAAGWLRTLGGGYAALVGAERWSYTVDRKDVDRPGLWSFSDGAGAIVLGLGIDQPPPPVAVYRGAGFVTQSKMNGAVLIKYGGTRYPVAPPGEDPFLRRATVSKQETKEAYRQGYTGAFGELRRLFPETPFNALVCNQISPPIVSMIGELAGVPPEHVVTTGHEAGHMGPADLVLGLERAVDQGVRGNIVVGSSTFYAFGAGLLSRS